jgi:MFS family permease
MFHGWRVVGVCFAAAVFTWGLGVFGGSVYLAEIRKAHGWPTDVVSSALTMFYLTNALSLPAVGAAIDRWGPRPVIATGALLLAAGVAAVGRLEALWQLYAAFLCMGLGYATMSVTGLSATIAPWFERHQGRSIALALTGASVGAMLVVPVLVFGIVALGFAEATLWAAITVVLVMTPLALVVLRVRRPADLGLARDGGLLEAVSAEAQGPTAAGKSGAPSAAARKSAVRSWRLWSVAVGFALGLVVQVGFLTHHYALALPMIGAEGAGLLVGATGAAGLLGRLLLARVIDRADPRRYSMGVFAVQTVVLAAFWLWPSVPVLIPVSLVYGFWLGQITTLSPIVVRREFGAEAFGAIYGVAGTAMQLCSAFGPLFYGLLVGWFGGYAAVLGVAAAFKIAAIATLATGAGSKAGRR